MIYKSYITQELLNKNILGSNIVYISVTHKQKEIDKYFYEFEKILKKIKSFENGEDIKKYINNVSDKSFKRLN